MKLSLTALILSYNEQENVGRTISALQWVDNIVLLDSFSTDTTLEVVRRSHRNVTVVQREFDTHAQQWNFGVEQVTTSWVLSLDADYIVTPELAMEIEHLGEESRNAYSVRFHYCIWGKQLRASLYPSRTVLFRLIGWIGVRSPPRCSYAIANIDRL